MTRKGPYGLKTTSKIPETLGGRVALIRKAWGWTQGDLASRLRLKTAAVSAWERGKAVPSGASLVSLAATLNTTPDALSGAAPFTIPDRAATVAELGWEGYRLQPPDKGPRVLLVQGGHPASATEPKYLRKLAQDALENGLPVWLVIGFPEGLG